MQVVAKSTLKPHLRGITKKHKVFVSTQREGDTVSSFGSWWDGGSKSDFYQLCLTTGRRLPLSYSSNPPEFGGKIVDFPLQKGYAIVQAGTFCGKPATPHLYILVGDENLLF